MQRNFLKALKAAGKKVVFVNCSGSAMALVPETQSCDAILQAWYSGEEGGEAVARVLLGAYNPSGKLPVTFYRDDSQLPDFKDYSMRGRTYRYMNNPLFPFGFGLSYTTFSIGKAKLQGDKTLTLSIPVKNTGKRDGTEVVQVYVRDNGDADGPLKTLKAFRRVDVKAGQTVTAEIPLGDRFFDLFDKSTNTVRTKAGTYTLYYGTSSDDRDLRQLTYVVK